MTKEELSGLFYLAREIRHDRELLAELRAYATGTSSSITGMPHLGKLADKTAVAGEIADLQAQITAKLTRCMAEYKRIYEAVGTVEDSKMRQILFMRHAQDLSFASIASRLGGNNTEAGVKMAYYRFFKKNV